MLTVRLLARRAICRPCIASGKIQSRYYADKKKGKWIKPPKPPRRTTTDPKPNGNGHGKSPDEASSTPSLVEQLFPEESKRYEEQQRQSREVPLLPLDDLPSNSVKRLKTGTSQGQPTSWAKQQLEAEMKAHGEGISILVLLNASPNLTEEDFRRLIPQGQHIEGWTLDQGDILKVIPGRSFADLSQTNTYYILFSSALGAFTYQGHVTRIHKLADAHTPTPAMSSVPPPPGYMIEGLDAHAAIQAYALVPPSQRLELRMLKRPFSPLMEALVRHQGFPQISNRPNKSPYEARLTMDGPQLPYSGLMHVLRETGKARGLSWSGGDNINLALQKWTPRPEVSEQGDTLYERRKVQGLDQASNAEDRENASSDKDQKRRTPPLAYIVGFHTEKAAMTFVQYWHRRPLDVGTGRMGDWFEGDVAPIANVQLLW